MKKTLLTIGLAIGLGSSALAQNTYTEAFTIGNNTLVTNLINFPCSVSKIYLIVNVATTNPCNYAIVDAPRYFPGWGSYATNYFTTPVLELTNSVSTMVSFLTNISLLITNYDGVVTNLYRSNVLYSAWGTAAATRTPYKRVITGSAAAAGTVTVWDSTTSPLRFANGFTLTNSSPNTNNTIVISYDPSL